MSAMMMMMLLMSALLDPRVKANIPRVNANAAPISHRLTNGPTNLAPVRPASSRQIRFHHLDAEEDSEVSCESLYARLEQAGRVPWSRVTLPKLRAENRCFRCVQPGHSARDGEHSPARNEDFRAAVIEDDPD